MSSRNLVKSYGYSPHAFGNFCRNVIYPDKNRRKREELLQNIGEVRNILGRGAERARTVAEKTMKEVKEKMGLTPYEIGR